MWWRWSIPHCPCPFFPGYSAHDPATRTASAAVLCWLLTKGRGLSEWKQLAEKLHRTAGALQRNEKGARWWNHIWVLLKAKPSVLSLYDCHSSWRRPLIGQWRLILSSDWLMTGDGHLMATLAKYSQLPTYWLIPINQDTMMAQHRQIRSLECDNMTNQRLGGSLDVDKNSLSVRTLRWKVTVGTDRDQRRLIVSSPSALTSDLSWHIPHAGPGLGADMHIAGIIRGKGNWAHFTLTPSIGPSSDWLQIILPGCINWNCADPVWY